MLSKKLLVLIAALAPLSAWAVPITGHYIGTEGSNNLNIDVDGDGYSVSFSKDDATSTCDFNATFEEDSQVEGKLFGKLQGCFITILVNGGWASITANGHCNHFCTAGSLDTQGLKHR